MKVSIIIFVYKVEVFCGLENEIYVPTGIMASERKVYGLEVLCEVACNLHVEKTNSFDLSKDESISHYSCV